MEFYPNFPVSADLRPDDWAAAMEAQGWDGVCASDHLWVGDNLYPHVFVAATQMAMATQRVRITTSFCNNLFRSPVEFAQASMALQRASNGRFEAGLGAGWLQDEIEAMGEAYPPARDRVRRYVEALTVVGQLLRTGQADFDGAFYQVHITGGHEVGPRPEVPPPLIASAGGPRSIREVTPLVDRVEVKANARATRVGHLDLGIMATITEDELRQSVDRVREVRPDVPIGTFLLVGVSPDPRVDGMKAGLGDGYLGRFLGEAGAVADALRELERFGIDRVQLTGLTASTFEQLAPLLTD